MRTSSKDKVSNEKNYKRQCNSGRKLVNRFPYSHATPPPQSNPSSNENKTSINCMKSVCCVGEYGALALRLRWGKWNRSILSACAAFAHFLYCSYQMSLFYLCTYLPTTHDFLSLLLDFLIIRIHYSSSLFTVYFLLPSSEFAEYLPRAQPGSLLHFESRR